MTIQRRKSIYRGKTGFTISGRNTKGMYNRIFSQTKEGSRIIQLAAKRGNSTLINQILRKGG